MFATASTHLPQPLDHVRRVAFGPTGAVPWFPELERSGETPLDVPGARSVLRLPAIGWPPVVVLRTDRVVRSTIVAVGHADRREVALTLSLSRWHGGTAAVLSLDAGGRDRPWLAWGATRRLEAALVALGAASRLAPARRARP